MLSRETTKRSPDLDADHLTAELRTAALAQLSETPSDQLWLIADGLGRPATLCAAVLTAISPAMVFYSRYFIHEMLLVFFTTLTLGAGWKYAQKNFSTVGGGRVSVAANRGSSAFWAILAGVGCGLMFATKETFVLTLTAIGLAALVTAVWKLPRGQKLETRRPLVEVAHRAIGDESARAQTDVNRRLHFAPERA